MKRIAVAGFQHETNTFGVGRADYAAFEEADAWPGLLTGESVVGGTAGANLPIAGFVAAARAHGGFELAPVLWCSAEPCAQVTDDAYERIAGMLLDGVRGAGDIDGVYLDLHGAMVTESLQDGEGELLARLRQVVGPELPVAVSLDMHANITAAMVAHASSLCVFRTYPHIDMAATGARAFNLLRRRLHGGALHRAFRQAPFLVPLTSQHTGSSPCRELYAALEELESESPGLASADLAAGFPAADIRDAGPAVVAHAADAPEAERAADALLNALLDAEDKFENPC